LFGIWNFQPRPPPFYGTFSRLPCLTTTIQTVGEGLLNSRKRGVISVPGT
jgi:hypothetical protein